MGWISAEALTEEETPQGVWNRSELDRFTFAQKRRRSKTRRILDALAEGEPAHVIAEREGVSVRTVFRHRER